jgi:hypothetical protein
VRTVSRNDQAQAGHEGESEAKSESCIAKEPNGAQEGPPRQGDPGDPLCCGGCALTHPCVCVLSRRRVRKLRTHQVEFRYCNVGLIVIHD